jgi:hypothetical protein
LEILNSKSKVRPLFANWQVNVMSGHRMTSVCQDSVHDESVANVRFGGINGLKQGCFGPFPFALVAVLPLMETIGIG